MHCKLDFTYAKELSPELRFGVASRDVLLPPPTGMVSMLDRAFKGEL